MNVIIDTHSHIYDEQYVADEAEMLARAAAAGVHKIYMPNCDSSTIAPMMRLAHAYPTLCKPMMGLHPCYVKTNYKEELQLVADQLSAHNFYGVGEIGLDYYWDLSFKEEQIEALHYQIGLAKTYRLPIILHSRESTADCIAIVKQHQDGKLKGIFHCFSGSIAEAKAAVDLGFYLGIGGVVTYKKSNLPEIIQAVGMAHLVLETDAPYLSPIPYRGKRNESAYLPIIGAKVAEIAGISLEEMAQISTNNAENIFGK